MRFSAAFRRAALSPRIFCWSVEKLIGILRAMDLESPLPPRSFQVPKLPLADLKSQVPPKDWPHAPVHRLADHAVYCVTAATLHKRPLFQAPAQRDLLEGRLLSLAK